jgi:hypothetical protein
MDGKLEHYAVVLLVGCAQVFFISLTQYHHHCAVKANRGLDYVRHIMLVNIGIEVCQFFAAILLVLFQVEVGAAVYAFYFFESHREVVFYIACSISISVPALHGRGSGTYQALMPRLRCHFMRASFQYSYHSFCVPGLMKTAFPSAQIHAYGR